MVTAVRLIRVIVLTVLLGLVLFAQEKNKKKTEVINPVVDSTNIWVKKDDVLTTLKKQREALTFELAKIDGQIQLTNALADSVKFKKER